jgi:hypothetical protein
VIEPYVVTRQSNAPVKNLAQSPRYIAKARCSENIARSETMHTSRANISFGIQECDKLAENRSVEVDDHSSHFQNAVLPVGV